MKYFILFDINCKIVNFIFPGKVYQLILNVTFRDRKILSFWKGILSFLIFVDLQQTIFQLINISIRENLNVTVCGIRVGLEYNELLIKLYFKKVFFPSKSLKF